MIIQEVRSNGATAKMQVLQQASRGLRLPLITEDLMLKMRRERRQCSQFLQKAIALRKTRPPLFMVSLSVPKILMRLFSVITENTMMSFTYVELNLGKRFSQDQLICRMHSLFFSTKGKPSDALKPFEGNIYKIR